MKRRYRKPIAGEKTIRVGFFIFIAYTISSVAMCSYALGMFAAKK